MCPETVPEGFALAPRNKTISRCRFARESGRDSYPPSVATLRTEKTHAPYRVCEFNARPGSPICGLLLDRLVVWPDHPGLLRSRLPG